MFLCQWDKLPDYMRNSEVREYYDILSKKKVSLFLKRVMDIIVSAILIIILLIPMLVIAIMVKCDSRGPILFKQIRVTTNGRKFKILKFRTMVDNAEQMGGLITEANDKRITKLGEKIRKYRLDELPQVFNVFVGDMSFVGTRPEVVKYVDQYSPDMYATLLTPAGITSMASITYKDNDEFFTDPALVDKNYIEIILPEKMKLNLDYYRKFNVFYDIKIMFKTVGSVLH
ncbi:MAG: sugar transferase [Acutalibacteraceae bacterium]|nr:sugar transferase [Acutalibacteraceae bacterium]